MWCKSLTPEKYIKIYKIYCRFAPFFVCFSLSAFKLGATAMFCSRNIGLYTRPEIKSWPDVKFCAHAQCVLPRCYQKPVEFTQKLITPYGFLVYYNHPTYFKVTRLVKEVNCQYAFGVFTKWDKVIQESHEQISLDHLRERSTKKYLESVNSHDQRATIHEVFFVDSQHVLRQIKVSSFFLLWSTHVKKCYLSIESTQRE